MTSTSKRHYYLAHCSFKNRNAGHDIDQSVNSDFTTSSNLLNKSSLENIKASILNKVVTENPNMDIYDFRLNSLSYLGEMTEEEFNS